jgi:CRP-like cAMP-binding protein
MVKEAYGREDLIHILPQDLSAAPRLLRSHVNQAVCATRSRGMTDTLRVRVKAGGKSSVDGVVPAIQNSILLDLPPRERCAIISKLAFVDLPVRTILNETAAPIKSCYFVNSGLVSIVKVMADGKSVEVGLTGGEGFVGLPLIVGYGSSGTRAIVQIAASAFRISARNMKAALRDCPKLEKSLQRYAQELAIQSAQIAACNRLHEVEERLARWLLMSVDRVGGSSFALTQEFVSHMLGTRRASVTVAAGILQKAGLITYKRGLVKIEDRRRLEEASCECYKVIRRQIESWQRSTS